ncbi:hypothetical protein IIA16_04510, partial [bacterium]|nr:hypothetical protein [bacterium]
MATLSQWAFTHGVEVALLIATLAALGGLGWQAERTGGRGRAWGGAWLALFVVLVPQMVSLAARVLFPVPERGGFPSQGIVDPDDFLAEAGGGTDPLLALSILAPFFLLAWVASQQREQRAQALRMAMVIGALGVAVALAGVGLDRVEGGRMLGQAIAYLLFVGFVPALVALNHRAWRGSALVLGLAIMAGFSLAGGLAMPQMVAISGDSPGNAGFAEEAGGEAADTNKTYLKSLLFLGPRAVRSEFTWSRWDGVSLRLAGQAEESGQVGEPSLRNMSLELDLLNLDVARKYLR